MPDATLLHPTPRGDASGRVARRDAWLASVAPSDLFHPLFDHVPGVFFFAKNRQSEIMFLSRGNRAMYGLSDEVDVVGLTDYDLVPAVMAAGYVGDDQEVLATGRPLVGRVELWFDALGTPAWYATTKLPIRSRAGEAVGVMGVSQEVEGRARGLAPWAEIEPAVRVARDRFREAVTVADMATAAGLSVRQLERKFRAALGVTPREFVAKCRVLAACQSLRESETTLSAIAIECGFYDQSAFTEQFRRYVGQTPLKFRKSFSTAVTAAPRPRAGA